MVVNLENSESLSLSRFIPKIVQNQAFGVAKKQTRKPDRLCFFDIEMTYSSKSQRIGAI